MKSLTCGVILVIDPKPVEWTQTQRLLDCQGYDVCRASDESSAIGMALHFDLGLILCHELLEQKCGLDLVHRVLQKHPDPRPAVMFTSKNQSAGVILRKHVFGPALHVKQPVDASVLLELVERMIGVPHKVQPPRSDRPVPLPGTPVISDGFQALVAPN